MGKAHRRWKPLAHEPIEKLAENLWYVRGTLPGMSLRRTMAVAKLADGGLVIHNGIALDDASQAELEAWGTPKVLIVPNGLHRLDAHAYKERYPQLRVLAPRGAHAKVTEVVPVDADYEHAELHDDSVQLEMLHGLDDVEGVMKVRSSDGTTVVLNDAMFNMELPKDLLGKTITAVLGSAPGPRVSRLAKLAFIKDKKALRADFERFAALDDLVRVIVAHDKVASGADARAALLAAASYL